MKIDEVCSRQAVHIPLSCTLQEAAVQMRDTHVGSLIVTESTPSGVRGRHVYGSGYCAGCNCVRRRSESDAGCCRDDARPGHDLRGRRASTMPCN
ncbi:hypothetical protein D9M68_354610 [compost metagenome]